jgi:hypothetical protein
MMNVDCYTNVYFTFDPDFPIFLIKDFIVVQEDLKEEIKSVILGNMDYHYNIKKKEGYNFPIIQDNDFFLDVYYKFYNICSKIFGELNITENCVGCHSYVTDNKGFGINKIHNHLETSTISACYYINIPEKCIFDQGSISFFSWEEKKELLYRPSTFDLIIFPNYLDHKINYSPHKEERITITMEIQCEEKSIDIFSMPFPENNIAKNEKNLFKYYKKVLL